MHFISSYVCSLLKFVCFSIEFRSSIPRFSLQTLQSSLWPWGSSKTCKSCWRYTSERKRTRYRYNKFFEFCFFQCTVHASDCQVILRFDHVKYLMQGFCAMNTFNVHNFEKLPLMYVTFLIFWICRKTESEKSCFPCGQPYTQTFVIYSIPREAIRFWRKSEWYGAVLTPIFLPLSQNLPT